MSEFDTQFEKDIRHIKQKLSNLIDNLNIVLIIILFLLVYIALK